MALIKWGMFVVDGRGKVGGHVLTKTRHGATVRTKVTPTNPRKPAQSAIRSKFGALSSQWNGLTENQRASYNEAVQKFQKTNIFGDLKSPTGRELFIRCNMGRLQLGLAVLEDAPDVVPFPELKVTSVVFDLTSSLIELTGFDGLSFTDFGVQIMATAPQSAGRYNFDGQYRVITDEFGGDPSDLYDDYVAKFGVPADGTAVGFQIALISRDNGIKSASENFRAIAHI